MIAKFIVHNPTHMTIIPFELEDLAIDKIIQQDGSKTYEIDLLDVTGKNILLTERQMPISGHHFICSALTHCSKEDEANEKDLQYTGTIHLKITLHKYSSEQHDELLKEFSD